MITLQELKTRLMRDPQFQEEYEEADALFSLVEAMISARLSANLTQSEVAERMGTTQSAIARLEGGWVSPSFATLRRFAEATGTSVRLKFLVRERLIKDEDTNRD